jgi:hypothetical protein
VFNRNITNILENEIIDKNCLISSLKLNNTDEEGKESKVANVKEYLIKTIDNRFSKKII